MKIAVCVKHVPEAGSARRIDPGTNRLDRSGEGALNRFDANAVEEALRLLVQTRGQTAIRRLRGKVTWEGDLNVSRLARFAK